MSKVACPADISRKKYNEIMAATRRKLNRRVSSENDFKQVCSDLFGRYRENREEILRLERTVAQAQARLHQLRGY